MNEAEQATLRTLAERWQTERREVGAIVQGVLRLLAPTPGRLMVARVNADAAAVKATEALACADYASEREERGAAAQREVAFVGFLGAFRALDRAHEDLRAVAPRDADLERLRRQVAFILQKRLERCDALWHGLTRHLAVAYRLEMLGAGGTVAEVVRAHEGSPTR